MDGRGYGILYTKRKRTGAPIKRVQDKRRNSNASWVERCGNAGVPAETYYRQLCNVLESRVTEEEFDVELDTRLIRYWNQTEHEQREDKNFTRIKNTFTNFRYTGEVNLHEKSFQNAATTAAY